MAAPRLRGSGYLLASLVLLLVTFPALTDLARPVLLTSVVAGVFLGGVIVVEPGKHRVRIAIVLAALQIALTMTGVWLLESSFVYRLNVFFGLGTTAILIIYCIYCVLRYVLQAARITRDQIYAGISVYLMIGFAFGSAYYLINALKPGGFAINAGPLAADPTPDLMYFSFVTLATLGYGDITPVARTLRVLAELESLAGTLYMAIFMARLVSLHSSHHEEAHSGE